MDTVAIRSLEGVELDTTQTLARVQSAGRVQAQKPRLLAAGNLKEDRDLESRALAALPAGVQIVWVKAHQSDRDAEEGRVERADLQ
eukprot:5546284-Amphidinium_carterae.1